MEARDERQGRRHEVGAGEAGAEGRGEAGGGGVRKAGNEAGSDAGAEVGAEAGAEAGAGVGAGPRADGTRGDGSGDALSIPRREPRRVSRVRRVPGVRLALYYAVLIAVGAVGSYYVPVVRQALMAPVAVPALDQAGGLFGIQPESQFQPLDAPGIPAPFDRSIITLIVIVGAFALALPVAWVYMATRRMRYDPSLVHSVIILPVVVAGIVILVKNSLALAFSLAGIVAVVRFRNTLKDPKDAVYVFLVLGIGLAAGVQALDVALLVSVAFNAIVLGLWKYNIGGIYARTRRGGLLTMGDASLLPLDSEGEELELRERALDLAARIDAEAYMLVYAADPVAARRGVEVSLSEHAKKWNVALPERARGRLSRFLVALTLRKKRTPVDLLGDLEERWPGQVAAAEYVPLWTPDDDDEEEDDD